MDSLRHNGRTPYAYAHTVTWQAPVMVPAAELGAVQGRGNVSLQAVAEKSRQQVSVQDLTRGMAQRAAQQRSGTGAIQPKDAVAAARAGMACFLQKQTLAWGSLQSFLVDSVSAGDPTFLPSSTPMLSGGRHVA